MIANRRKHDSFINIPDAKQYSGVSYPTDTTTVDEQLNKLRSSSTPTQPQPTQKKTDIPALHQDLIRKIEEISHNYFNKGIKPALEVNLIMDKLQERLNNIGLKLVELNIKPQNEPVFY
jgi:capsule polysaccharide export protein KpsE/RkpR